MAHIFFNSLGFVLEKTKSKKQFNLFAVVYEPPDVKSQELNEEFDFIGYELLDQPSFTTSALTTCWPLFKEINPNSLISDYNIIKSVQENLKNNRHNESHADCGLFEVWRHKIIRRKWLHRTFPQIQLNGK